MIQLSAVKDSRSTRTAVALLGMAAYVAVTGVAITRSWQHFELIGILLQYAVLLPAVVYGLRTADAAAALSIPSRPALWLACAFLAIAAAVSWRVSEGSACADEESYRFQALTLAAGEMSAPPPPGAPEHPGGRAGTPRALYFEQQILSRAGWYSKYPIGWPAVLALPERMNLGWLVSPFLGVLLLLVTGLAAREAFGPATVLPAVAMAGLSPYFLANSVGRMSHTLSGLLVASATVLCIQGLKTGKLLRFGWMFLLLVATFHVRPLTALSASVVLGLGALIGTRARRVLCMRVAALGAAAAVLAVSSFFLYNWRFTGNPLLTPYALADGTNLQLSAVVPMIGNWVSQEGVDLATLWRQAAQSTVLYAFPFLGLLVIYYFWASRPRSPIPWILLALPCTVMLFPMGSGSVIGQRYWFEGYFAIVVLAAGGLTRLLAAWRPGRRTLVPVAIGLAVTQLVMMALAATALDKLSSPRREVKRLAQRYQDCDCVVYFEDTPPDFYAMHLNPNRPDWQSAHVFYAVDPGPDERAKWVGILGKRRWVVLRYDAQRKVAEVDGTGSV